MGQNNQCCQNRSAFFCTSQCASRRLVGNVYCPYHRLYNTGRGACLQLKHQQLCQLCYDSLGENDQKKWIGSKEWGAMLRTFGKACNWT